MEAEKNIPGGLHHNFIVLYILFISYFMLGILFECSLEVYNSSAELATVYHGPYISCENELVNRGVSTGKSILLTMTRAAIRCKSSSLSSSK